MTDLLATTTTTAAATTTPAAAATVSIRPVASADHATEADIVSRAFAAGPYGHLPRSEERRAFEADTVGREAAGAVIVAERAGRIIGSASVLRGGGRYTRVSVAGEAEIRLLAVDPEQQGTGAGEALMRGALETALQWGAAALVLDTGSLNTRAQALYERLGFARVGEREEPADGDGVQPLVYSYPLRERADVVVRLMRRDEAPAVAAIIDGAYAADYELNPGYRAQMSTEAVAARAEQHLVWVAADAVSGELLGSVSTPRPGQAISELAGPGELDFRLLAVAPSARRRGIGEALSRHVILLARLRGDGRVVMNSGPEMVGAHRLYARLGFARIPEREITVTRDDGTSFDLLTFGLDIR